MNNTATASIPQQNIPQIMRRAKRWLLWRSVPAAKPGDKPRKVPIYASGKPRSGKLDTPADTKQLVTYTQAVKAMRGGAYAGVGFALGGGWQGLDLDGVRDAATGAIEPWALDIVQAVDTYSEVSPSGKGVHLIGRGDAMKTLGSNKSGVEFYAGGRYFTVTGQPINGHPTLKLTTLAPVYSLAQKRWLQFSSSAPVTSDSVKQAKPPTLWIDAAAQFTKHLPALDSDDRDMWLRVGMAIHKESAGTQKGFDLWCEWSMTSDKFNPDDQLRVWSSFKSDSGGVGVGSIIMMAREATKPQPVQRAPTKLPSEFLIDDLNTMDIAPTEWLVDGLIAPGLTLLAAPPKTGKSYLVLQMCLCVAAGVPFLGRETSKQRVSYFDLEEWHGLLKERYLPIKAGNSIPNGVPLKVKLEAGVGEQAIADIKTEINAGSKLIVVDIFARIRDELGEDAKKNAYARDMNVMKDIATFALNHPGVAIIIVHHANKGNHDNWMDKVSGSAGLTGGAHSVMYMARPDMRGWDEEAKKDGQNYRVLHASGKQVKEQELAIEKMEDGAGWQLSAYEPWEINATFKQKKIIALLHTRYPEYVGGKEVAELLGMKHANVRQIMHRMAEDGMIESEGRGGAGFRAKPAA